MSVHIIIDGPDNGGKSTLAAKLQECVIGRHFKAVTLQNDQLTFDAVVDYLTRFRQSDKITIWDRYYYPTDIIYNPVLVNRQSLLAPHVRIIEQMLNLGNTLLIHVTADEEELLTRFDIRGDEYITKDMYKSILQRYESFLANTSLPFRTINTSRHNQKVTLELAKMYIEQFYEQRMGKQCTQLR